ncbi:MAG: hemerythrin domain-containing protein [Melioribacteraceae bacterium]|nr:hemerythrin domain-containing protein [Melioribacteraceae bacterium]
MKRHPALIPLSHDHHQCLIIANKLCQDPIGYKPNLQEIQDRLVFLKSKKPELLSHFKIEEELLFNFVLENENSFKKSVDELREEHKHIADLLDSISDDDNLEQDLNEFGNALEKHIRKEERIFFQEVQKKLDEQKLSVLSKNIFSSFITNCNLKF